MRISEIISLIDSYDGSRVAESGTKTIDLRLSDAADLKDGLCKPVNSGTLFVRHLFRALKLDEKRIFTFRFEHKSIQAQVLAHYCPGSVPLQLDFNEVVRNCDPETAYERLTDLHDAGYIIKSALGEASASGKTGPTDRYEAIRAQMPRVVTECDSGNVEHERFLIQRLVQLATEYRVHSIEDSVIPSLTFDRWEVPATDNVVVAQVNKFVARVISRLPSGLLKDSLYGWDIGVDPVGRCYVLEVNSSGVHPVFRPGFQCSGYFQSRECRICNLARLVSFCEEKYAVEINIDGADRGQLTNDDARTYRLVAAYRIATEFMKSVLDGGTSALTKKWYALPDQCRSVSVEANMLVEAMCDSIREYIRHSDTTRGLSRL
jgi:hypothetical protein